MNLMHDPANPCETILYALPRPVCRRVHIQLRPLTRTDWLTYGWLWGIVAPYPDG